MDTEELEDKVHKTVWKYLQGEQIDIRDLYHDIMAIHGDIDTLLLKILERKKVHIRLHHLKEIAEIEVI